VLLRPTHIAVLLAVNKINVRKNQRPKHHARIERLPASATVPLLNLLIRCQHHSRSVGAKLSYGGARSGGARVVPDGQSAVNLAVARLRHIAGTAWSIKRYLNIALLKDRQMRGAITA
jgi:hypothetical protein